MEKVYSVLDKEDSWWEDFYRIKGYHYGKAGDEKKASEARRLSLDLIQKQLKKTLIMIRKRSFCTSQER